MKKTILIKLTLLVVSVILLSSQLLTASQVEAADLNITTREEWNADELLMNFEEKYNLPKKMEVLLIDKKDISSNSQTDVRELYYYFSTRSGFGDLPFHYVLCWDGEVYAGNSLGAEADIKLGEEKDTLFIAYILDDSQELSISASDPLRELILREINKYAIAPEKVSIKKMSYSFEEKAKMKDIKFEDVSESWKNDFERILKSVTSNYNPSGKVINVEVLDLIVPDESLEPAGEVEIKIKLKNTGDFNIYSGGSSNIFVARDKPLDEKSLFYLADDWDSLSRVALLGEGERLVVGEEGEYSFKVFVPLYPPEKSEDFVLLGTSGKAIAGTEFKLTLKIKDIDSEIIEITDTPVGFLNVRDTPGYGDVVTKVSPGDRFVVLGYENGYYKIEANGKEGWVVQTYVKKI